MLGPSMKFQNHILNFEQTYAVTEGRTTSQAQSNMPIQLFQSWGHKKNLYLGILDILDTQIKVFKQRFAKKKKNATYLPNSLFVWFDSLRPSQQFLVIQGQVFLCWISSKQGLMCLAQGHNVVTRVRLEPITLYLESSPLPLSHCAPPYPAVWSDKPNIF